MKGAARRVEMAGTKTILVLGNTGHTHLGESFHRAASALGLDARLLAINALPQPTIVDRLSQKVGIPVIPSRAGHIANALRKMPDDWLPDVVLITGTIPIQAATIADLKERGSIVCNFMTDDPWNPGIRKRWLFASLQAYDAVFTPRRANLGDLAALGVPQVEYLPFGYDEKHFHCDDIRVDSSTTDVLLVGGADEDRLPFARELLDHDMKFRVYGAYWNRMLRGHASALGIGDVAAISRATNEAKVSLCLVRRANRDGHVMRSYEIPASGGCMLAEDTEDHRNMFGSEGECVLYFTDPADALAKARTLCADVGLRRSLARAARQRITNGANTYTDRLRTIVESLDRRRG
jgi:spore maturation protein CgeB